MNAIESESNVEDIHSCKEVWLQEIIRETEHYYQGELQQDQRASWLLTTVGILIALLLTFRGLVLNRESMLLHILFVTSLGAFVSSASIAVLALVPLHGTRPWRDTIGKKYRQDRKIGINQLVKERFRVDSDWSTRAYEEHIKYHFRSHYLRFIRKSYSILWSAWLLLLGLVLLTTVLFLYL